MRNSSIGMVLTTCEHNRLRVIGRNIFAGSVVPRRATTRPLYTSLIFKNQFHVTTRSPAIFDQISRNIRRAGFNRIEMIRQHSWINEQGEV